MKPYLSPQLFLRKSQVLADTLKYLAELVGARS